MRTILAHVSSAIRSGWLVIRDRLWGGVATARQSGDRHTLRACLEHINLPGAKRADTEPADSLCRPVDPDVLNARARIGRQAHGDSWQSILLIEICGAIEAPDDDHEVGLEIALHDVTDGPVQAAPVLTRPKQGPLQGSSHFVYRTDMGKLCHRKTILEDYTVVAQLSPEWFVLPRQGPRRLQCQIAVTSRRTGSRLARASCAVTFENLEIGYLDMEDNIQRAKTLAVGLAFSVAAADDELSDPEVNVIHGWVRTQFGVAGASAEARLELDRALGKTTAFFRRGGRVDSRQICREILEIAPLVGRLDILDLCLRVAGAKGQVTAAELDVLKDISDGLAIDRARLRAMAEKVLPIHMHATQDAEMVLGVTDEMNTDQTRHQLNREYAKWSSRVISSDPAIRRQADQMLTLIANARTQYVGVKLSAQDS